MRKLTEKPNKKNLKIKKIKKNKRSHILLRK